MAKVTSKRATAAAAVFLALVGWLSTGFAQPTGFQHYGNFKRMMHTGDTAAQVELSKLDQSAGTWGVGALAGLKGEIIQVDGKLLVSLGTDPDGKVQSPSATDGAVLWASGKVAQWRQIQVPADMSQAEFEKFVSEQAAINKVDLKQPFVFRVTGGYSHLIWHVLTGEKSGHKAGGHGGHGHAGGHTNKRSDMKVFRNPTATGQLVAVYSGEKLEGVVSHPGERFHVHYIDDANTVSGHVDQYNVQRGATLWLPVFASEPAFVPRASPVTDNVYAIIGPLGQRSEANAGLNANYGFVISANGVILIDSGASAHSAAMLEKAVKQVTPKLIRWVLNTGSQDHRWLGNGYFASKGAEIHAMAGSVKTQQSSAQQQLDNLKRFVGTQLVGTVPSYATKVHPAPEQSLVIDGVRLQWVETSAHYPGDTMIYLPDMSVAFTGDLVYVDRILGVLPQSNVRKAQASFQRLEALKPKHVVPGHGRVTDLSQAKRETGDYYDFLIKNVGAAARNMDSIGETLDKFAKPAQFMHLENFADLHRANMNRVFVDFEANP